MNTFEVFGIITTVKDGKPGTRLVLTSEFSEYAVENAQRCDGLDCITEFTRLDCSALKVGDIIELFYNKGFQGKAVLAGFRKVTDAK